MINIGNGVITISGEPSELISEFVVITLTIKEQFSETFGEDNTTELLEKAFNDGMKGFEELEKELLSKNESESEEK